MDETKEDKLIKLQAKYSKSTAIGVGLLNEVLKQKKLTKEIMDNKANKILTIFLLIPFLIYSITMAVMYFNQ